MIELFMMLVVFQVKHFVSDYPLQTQYMLRKANKNGWVVPLLCHAGVHSVFTLIIILFVNYDMWYLAVLDFVVHFTVDRIKASPSIGGRFNPSQPYFWWALGLDQMAHHITHYFIIYMILV